MVNFNKKISKPAILTIVIILVVFLGGIVLGYYLFPQKKGNEIPEIKLSEVQREETVKEEETVNWKIYRNKKYGFEIRYPENYKTEEIPYDNPTGLGIFLDKGKIDVQKIDDSIMNIDLPENCMFNSGVLEKKNMLSFVDAKEINGINFYYYRNYPEYISGYCGMSAGCWYEDVYRTFYNGKCYQILYLRSDRSFVGDVTEVPRIFNQILSTFRFID